MNELEKAISSSDDELNVYLENVETEDFRAQVNRPTIAQPNKWSGLECFEHRRN